MIPMDNYRMRQGTVYRRCAGGEKLLLIHHNVMNMESLVLREKDGKFDISAPALLDLDTLIAMRRSGEFEDAGDLPKAEVSAMIAAMISAGSVTPDVAEMLQAVRDELEKA